MVKREQIKLMKQIMILYAEITLLTYRLFCSCVCVCVRVFFLFVCVCVCVRSCGA